MSSYIPHRHRLWLYLFSAFAMFYLVLPTLIVIPMSFSATESLAFPPRGFSFRWYVEYFTSPEWRDATLVSLKLACLTTLLAAPIGTAAAYALHVSSSPHARLLRGALVTPLLVPVILFAIAAYFVLVQLRLINTLAGLVFADAVLTLPLMFITVGAGLKSYDMRQEMVARSLGATRLWAFLTVTLPEIKYSVMAGALFVFITAFDESVIASMLTAGDQATLTNRMFQSLLADINPVIAAISVTMIAITMLPPIILHLARMPRRRAGALQTQEK